MTIKTIEQYRALISKKPKRSSGSQSTDMKYFIAGFIGAATAVREPETRDNKNMQATK